MTDILEKADLLEFESRIMAYLELITSNPMKEWFTLEELAELRNCSVSVLKANVMIQPNHGIPDDRWGRERAWSRDTVKAWLRKTKSELEAIATSLNPREMERIELIRKSKSYQGVA